MQTMKKLPIVTSVTVELSCNIHYHAIIDTVIVHNNHCIRPSVDRISDCIAGIYLLPINF